MYQRTILAVSVLLLAIGARADFSYDQSTKLTGGAMAGMMRVAGAFSKQARMPQTSTVMVKGDRMATVHGESAQIIDLTSETITDVDYNKKTYSVITFAQIVEAMKKMSEKLQKDPRAGEMKFKLDVKDTGNARDIQGLPTKEVLLILEAEATDKDSGQKGAMKIVSDMWITPGISGYAEVRAFHQKMAQKMAIMPGAFGGMMQPGMMQGMSELSKQASKLEGVPVLQVVKLGEGMAPASGAPSSGETKDQTPPPSAGEAANSAAASAITGRLGRLGGFRGFGRKKKEQEPPKEEQAPAPEAQTAAAASGTPGALMEITTELTSFSSAAVDPSKMQVPTGFKQVESPMLKAID